MRKGKLCGWASPSGRKFCRHEVDFITSKATHIRSWKKLTEKQKLDSHEWLQKAEFYNTSCSCEEK